MSNNSKFPHNAKKPINSPLAQNPTPGQQEAQNRLASLLGGGRNRPVQYTPITKSLEQAEIEPRMMEVFIDDKLEECLVIPMQELIYKEWKHMTGANQSYQQPQREGNHDQGSAEVGGQSDVSGGSD